MSEKITRTWGVVLFNPFIFVAGGEALGLGLGAIVLAAVIGWFSATHFDGVLDTHIGASAPLTMFLLEGLADWLSAGVVLLIAGRMISRSWIRVIDVFGTQALARWATIISSLITLAPGVRRFSHELIPQIIDANVPVVKVDTVDAIVFFTVVLALLPLFCWMMVLMYNAFAVSCNVRGGKAVGVFVAGVIVAEILSKLVLMGIFYLLR